MNNIYQYQVYPFSRLIWASKDAKEYWDDKFKRVQVLVSIAQLEAFKKGVLKSFTLFQYKGTDYTELINSFPEGTEEKLRIEASNIRFRPHKAYLASLGEGWITLYSNSNIITMNKDSIKDYELYLSFGYSNADMPNYFWYNSKVTNKIIDPSMEMANDSEFNFLLNPYLRHLGIYILPYIAKSWDDQYSLNLANNILDIMREIDEETTKDLITLLEMPIRISSWRGVTEIDIPIFKTMTNTTTYKEKIVKEYEIKMSYLLRDFIPGAPYGIRFPWKRKSECR